MKIKILFVSLILGFTFSSCAERDNINDPKNPNFSVGASSNPSSGKTITAHEIITIVFSDPISTSSLSLGGDMGSVVVPGNISWTTTYRTNDTLVVAPASGSLWPVGTGKTLTATCTTIDNNSASVNFSYTVFKGASVSADGLGTNPGTVRQPLLTISQGITKVQTLYTTGEVRVAEGNYSIDASSSPINIIKDISLYGGYAKDFQSRNAQSFISSISDSSTTGGTSGSPKPVISSGSDISTTTIIDGLTITGGTGDYTTAIYCTGSGSSPTIQNNVINAGGDGSNKYRYAIYLATNSSPKISNNSINSSTSSGGASINQCYGIYIDTSSPVISGNTIKAGKSGNSAGQESYAIRSLSSSNPTISSNSIDAGQGYNTYGVYIREATVGAKIINNLILGGKTNSAGSNYSIYIYNTAPIIRNNTVTCGESSTISTAAYCIYLASVTTSSIIDNNIFSFISGSSSYTAYAIYEASASSDASSVKNNCYNNFPDNDTYRILYHNNTTTTDWKTISDMKTGLNNETADTASDNISADPKFSSNYHLTSSSPSTIYSGGIDGATPSWDFTTDKDGVTRTGDGTTGWSMGCYEYNP